jgi:hypothetical protein
MGNSSHIANSLESIPDPVLEARHIQEVADLTVKLLAKRYPSPNQILRGVHAKAHGCVDAVFEVLPDIDQDLQIGLFSRLGATYRAVVRFSNAAVLVEPDLKDGKNGSRGMAIKIMDVDGGVLFDDHGRSSQDFLMINTPSFAFANIGDYLRLTQVLLANDDNPLPFFAPFPGITPEQLRTMSQSGQVLKQIQSQPVANPLEIRYFSASPYLFGPDRAMHFSAAPVGAVKPQVVAASPSPDYLREALQKTMSGNQPVVFEFKVQVRDASETDLHIEDATQAWDETATPFATVARITIPAPQTGLDTPERLQECEQQEFTPWHALAAHQPLGGINRLRKEVYISSATHRRQPSGNGG